MCAPLVAPYIHQADSQPGALEEIGRDRSKKWTITIYTYLEMLRKPVKELNCN